MEEKPHRQKRIKELVKRTVGSIVAEEFNGPEVLVTVSNVLLSQNHQHATIFITVYPYEKSGDVIKNLEENIGSVQKQLNHNLRMRPVPKISFKLDESEEKGQHILDLLDKVK